MKTLILILSLMVLVSCGKESESAPYILPVNTINKQWVKAVAYPNYNGPDFTSIDLTDMNNVVITDVTRNGIAQDCVYSVNELPYNQFQGIMEFTYKSGDTFVCSQLTGQIGYKALNDTEKGFEYLVIKGIELR